MMEHSQVERKVDLMVVLKVALMAYYWADLMVLMKADYSVEMMVRYSADYSVEMMEHSQVERKVD